MADRRFNIRDKVTKKKATLNIPPFANGESLSAKACTKTRRIAAVRIHVERAIHNEASCFKVIVHIIFLCPYKSYKDFSTPIATPTSNFNTPSATTTSERISCLQPLPAITNDNTPRSDSTTDINMNVGVDEARSALLINQPLSMHEIEKGCYEVKRNLFLNDDDISKVQREIRGQSANEKWFDHRFGRVTASKCHRVACPHKAGTSPSKIIKQVLNYNERFQTKAMREGIENDELIITQYKDKVQKEGHGGLEV